MTVALLQKWTFITNVLSFASRIIAHMSPVAGEAQSFKVLDSGPHDEISVYRGLLRERTPLKLAHTTKQCPLWSVAGLLTSITNVNRKLDASLLCVPAVDASLRLNRIIWIQERCHDGSLQPNRREGSFTVNPQNRPRGIQVTEAPEAEQHCMSKNRLGWGEGWVPRLGGGASPRPWPSYQDRVTSLHMSMMPDQVTLYDPYGLVLHLDDLFLVGRSHRANALRVFKVTRILSARPTSEPFDRPEKFDLSSLFRTGFGIVQSDRDPVQIVVQFNGAAAAMVEERIWHDSQRLGWLPIEPDLFSERETEDTLIATFHLAEVVEFKRWLKGFGDQAVILNPDWLRQEVQDELLAAAARYAP